MPANCAHRPAWPCCGARRWARFRSATPSRCGTSRATSSSACSSRSAGSSSGAAGMQFSAAELAQRLGLAVQGDATTIVTGVATLARATPESLSFLANPRYRAQLAGSRAGIVVMREADAEGHAGTALVAADPYAAFAKAAALFEQREPVEPGIHPQAAIDPSARIDPGAHVGPFASIGARSVVEAGAVVGPGCVVGEDCVVGAG